jgi:hypothetical protein
VGHSVSRTFGPAVKTVRLDAPGLVAGFADVRPWFAMELVEGAQLLAAEGSATSASLARARAIAAELGVVASGELADAIAGAER